MSDSNIAGLLPQTVMLLGAAVVAVPLFEAAKLGSVVGYLVAGIIVGPQVFGLHLNKVGPSKVGQSEFAEDIVDY